MKKILLTILFSIITSTVYSQQINGVVQQMNGLVLLYHFNTGAGTMEYDPISKTSLTNNGAWVSGIYGNAISILDKTHYGTINTGSDIAFTSITVCFWLYYISGQEVGGGDTLVYRYGGTNGWKGVWQVGRALSPTTWQPLGIRKNPLTEDNTWLPSTNGAWTTHTFSFNITKKWVHLAVTYSNGSGSAWYMNGVLIESYPNGFGAMNACDGNTYVGVLPEGNYFSPTCYMDELAVFNRAISYGEVKMIYNSGKSKVRIKK